MELKRCARCGTFFTSDIEVCQNCAQKDKQDIVKLRGYIEENGVGATPENISLSTGISLRNLNRYLETEEFSNISSLSIPGANIRKH